MNTAKAKEAKDKAATHLALAALQQEQVKQSDLQPADGYINPYGRIGAVPPTTYSLTNQLNGTGTQSVINPET
tara:strand:- start:204 stop:422 length:219 start_codon:yes stop_codon:yes gene_type:complete